MKLILTGVVLLLVPIAALAQEASGEKRVPLSEKAIAFDGSGAAALEATLRTTALNGAADTPVTNISMVVRNISGTPYTFVTGVVTFYDGSGIRCGEGLFKAGALSADEAFETDTPGIRIRCSPATWRIVANSLLPRVAPLAPQSAMAGRRNLVISLNGEEHPIQLDRPMVIKVGGEERTIVVKETP
jgi:hypothetical protein